MKYSRLPCRLGRVDPITALAIGVGILGAGTVATQAFAPKGQTATPTPPPAPQAAAPPVQSPTGTAGTFKTGQGGPSFLGAAAAPGQQQLGQKTLLGT